MQLLLTVLIGKLLAIVIGLYFFKYLPRPYRYVLLEILLAAIAEILGTYVALHMHKHNLWLFNISSLIDAWLMILIATQLVNSSMSRKIFLGLMSLATIVWIIEIQARSIYNFAGFAMVSELVVLTGAYFFVLLSSSVFSDSKVLKQPVFWLAISTILYCAPNIPYWGLHSYLIAVYPKLLFQLGYINVILDIIRYPLVAVSFIILGQRKAILNVV